MSVTSTDIVNQALQLIGDNIPPVAGAAPDFDDSAAGKAASYLYDACVQTVARQWRWDMARNTVALTLSGNAAPVPWTYEYLYPPNGVEVWQLMPASIDDPNNPAPFNFVVANAVVNGQQQRVIHADLADAVAVYNNSPNENTWDSMFREAVVRLLASELSMALFGRPDTEQALLQSGAAFETIGEGKQG